MAQITYDDKVALNVNSDIADINKCNAADMNQIKNTINGIDAGTDVVSNLVVGSVSTKNLFGNYTIINGWIYGTGMRVNSTNGNRMAFIPCEANTTYTVSKNTVASSFRVGEYTSIPAMTPSNVDYVIPACISNDSGTTITYTTSSTAKYLIIHYANTGTDSESTILNSLASMQVEKGSATAYTPYQNLNPIGYSLVSDNGWEVKMYTDGTFEAWFPYINTNTSTATTSTSGWYSSSPITINGPSMVKTIYDYRVNASFTTATSFPIYWLVSGTFNLRFVLLSSVNISTATAYRKSAYMAGTWK